MHYFQPDPPTPGPTPIKEGDNVDMTDAEKNAFNANRDAVSFNFCTLYTNVCFLALQEYVSCFGLLARINQFSGSNMQCVWLRSKKL
jgi:hypothetical protein